MEPADLKNRIEVQPDDGVDRYHRQNLISWWDQDHLANAKVLVVGAGALGNEIVKNLVLTGVGQIIITDFDHIEYSNLARCVFFRPEDEGRSKAEVLAERAAALNSDVDVIGIDGDVRLTVGLGLIDEVDLVIGGLDNREARLFVNQACWKTGTPWIDGAIAGLMGVVRVFIPPETACYECTMSERDHELIAARRSCALLSKEQMAEGKVPTTATSASVIGAMEAQEAVKLLHRDRLGEPELAGAGFHFVGLTHDSYVVRYQPREDCMSHDSYDLSDAKTISGSETILADALTIAESELGEGAIVEFEHEVALNAVCGTCGHEESIGKLVDSLNSDAGYCTECGETWRLSFTHSVDRESPVLEMTPVQLGIPEGDVLVARHGMERAFIRTAPAGTIIGSLGKRSN